MTTYTKDPDSTERFGVNWRDRLGAATIDTVTWLTSPDGLTTSEPTHDDTSASVLVAGGVLGVTYRLTCRVTTSDGQTLDYSLDLLVQAA